MIRENKSPGNNYWPGGPHFNFEGLKFVHIKVIL